MMVAPTMEVMYSLGWKGRIGKRVYEIVEVKLRSVTIKKAFLLPKR